MSVSDVDCMQIPWNSDHLHAWRDGQTRYEWLRCARKQEPSSPATDIYDNDAIFALNHLKPVCRLPGCLLPRSGERPVQ